MCNITVRDYIHEDKYFVCQTHTTRIQPPTIMCLSSDLGARWNHVVREGRVVKDPTTKPNSTHRLLSLNLLKHSETYYPCMRIDYLAHTARQNSLNVLPKL